MFAQEGMGKAAWLNSTSTSGPEWTDNQDAMQINYFNNKAFSNQSLYALYHYMQGLGSLHNKLLTLIKLFSCNFN